ncbi:hypothetical protein [Kutzneria sp. CA-103260]|uniref:hypothetical protein n=1 Tax=Kutzneria sp. CA-103260 TaxID=2802641 RepID=UPI001BAA64D9|nr:hypothetical protein [Kutzneria sp. CA-103260]QUQ72195.1 hypothetical protein JJ691_99830 [Kutzneria sp. CA-103260]
METTRRTLLRLLTVGGAAAALPATVGAAQPDVVMIIRHGEKPPDSGKPYGVTADGTKDTSSLIVQGWQRAGALAGFFSSGAKVRVPDAIYAVDNSGGKHLRMAQTVTPLSGKLGIPLNTAYSEGNEAGLAAEVAKRTGTTLICWEHSAIPDIVSNLGPVTPTPPSAWADSRFDMVWVFTRSGSGWAFSQVPQLVLAGDSSTPMS